MSWIIDKQVDIATQFNSGIWDDTLGTAIVATNPATGNNCLDITVSTQLIHKVGNGDFPFSDSCVNNLFNKWTVEAHFYNLVGDVYVGQQASELDYRSVFARVSQTNGTFAIWLQDNYAPNPGALPADFNYANFRVRINYDELYVNVALIEYDNNNVSYRTTIKRWNPDLYVTNSLSYGNFSIGINGTVKIEHTSVFTAIPIGVKYIVFGDSISIGRALHSPRSRYADRFMQKFYDNGIFDQTITVMASGGAGLARIMQCQDAAIALQPEHVIILIGDNDRVFNIADSSFNQGWADLYKQYILNFQQAGIFVYVLAMTPDNDDPHWQFADYIMANFPTDPDFNHSLLKVLNTQAYLEIGGGNRNWNPLYSNGGAHPYPAGHKALGEYIYANK